VSILSERKLNFESFGTKLLGTCLVSSPSIRCIHTGPQCFAPIAEDSVVKLSILEGMIGHLELCTLPFRLWCMSSSFEVDLW
jgi:hypothetical protein